MTNALGSWVAPGPEGLNAHGPLKVPGGATFSDRVGTIRPAPV
jgi:hypothetical protein